ncbi:MAG: permease [Beggiatoa sp. IS2]|nr:MAG: permease [Beggiatoa sp. IS2]
MKVSGFLHLGVGSILFLFLVGFVGGLVSGFIGSGGAFVLTPAMMSMGVPAIVAVASNMCHKFPKALVGAIKRAKYGQVDVKLGIILGISAEIGVLVGAGIQTHIKEAFGNAGSNLYVSFVFVVVLAIVGGYVLYDAWKIYHSANPEEEQVSKLARWVQSKRIPGTMMYFKSIDTEISVLFTIPAGFFTGMLAATIAVGGFIGVPSMIYLFGVPSIMASATELVIAFIMGMGGSIKFAWEGFVDIRLAMIILAGSLFGIQLGAIGTTYVKPYMVKVVMGIIMILVLFSRGFMIPVYLSDLDYINRLSVGTAHIFSGVSYTLLIFALLTGGVIIFTALWRGRREHLQLLRTQETAAFSQSFSLPVANEINDIQLSPLGKFNRILLVTDGSEFSTGATREAIKLAQKTSKQLYVMSVVRTNPEYESLAPQLLEKEQKAAINVLEQVKTTAEQANLTCEALLRHGEEVHQEIVEEAEKSRMDIIIMGRRGKTGLLRLMMGSTTAKVIGSTLCSILVVPRAGQLAGKSILLAVDGSRYSDVAAVAAINIAKHLQAPIEVMTVVDVGQGHQTEAAVIVERIKTLITNEGIDVESLIVNGRPAESIVDTAKKRGTDLIVVGSHGRTGLEKVLMGSVSDRVIGLAECAVLIVKTY